MKPDSNSLFFFLKKFYQVAPYLLFFPLLAFVLSAVDIWHPDLDWHDQQRTYQLVLLGAVSAGALFLDRAYLPFPLVGIFVAIFVFGLASSVLAEWPFWALKEWGRYIALLLLAMTVGELGHRCSVRFLLIGLIAFVAFAHALQFLLYYLSAFISGFYLLDADLLFNGFSNPRFFGQFQIMLMPILAFLILGIRI